MVASRSTWSRGPRQVDASWAPQLTFAMRDYVALEPRRCGRGAVVVPPVVAAQITASVARARLRRPALPDVASGMGLNLGARLARAHLDSDAAAGSAGCR